MMKNKLDLFVNFLINIFFSANIIFFSNGAMDAWFSPALPVLLSENSPLGAPLTNEQVSWIGSLNSFSGKQSLK